LKVDFGQLLVGQLNSWQFFWQLHLGGAIGLVYKTDQKMAFGSDPKTGGSDGDFRPCHSA